MFIGTVYEMTTTKRVLQTAMGIPNLVNSMNNNNNNNGNIAALNGHTNKGFVGKQLELHEIQLHRHIEMQDSSPVVSNGVDQQIYAKPKVVVPDVVKLSKSNHSLFNYNTFIQKYLDRYVPSNCSMLWSYFQFQGYNIV